MGFHFTENEPLQGHSGDAVKDLEAKLKYINETVPTNPQNIMGRYAKIELVASLSLSPCN